MSRAHTRLLELIDTVRGSAFNDDWYEEDSPTSARCHHCEEHYVIRPEQDRTPLCDRCAHEVVEEYTALLESAPDELLVEIALTIHARDQREDEAGRSAAV